jgi:outer membrane protein OmpA-like peptidoglycan-associated protein
MALVLGLTLVAFAASAPAASAQSLKDRLKKKVENKVDRRTDQAMDKAVEGALNKAENAVTCKVSDARCIQNAEKSGKPVQLTDEKGTVVGNSAAEALKPGQGAWANYDFIPGERVLFVDDFAADRVGNFPQRLQFKSGNMEIVEWQGARWLRGEKGEFFIDLPEVLPERFTMEFGLSGSGNAMEFSFVNDHQGQDKRVEVGTYFARLRAGEIDGQGELGLNTEQAPVKIRISVDGKYLKLYANEKRALNVPNADLGRSKRIYFNMNGWSAESPRLISDLRVMAGGRQLYDALNADGRVATQGILFDTGSDRLRPESTPTLKEIGDMLKAHPELRIRIEGHTDNVGAAASNQALSEKRAAAVKAYLEQELKIDGTRLEAQGFGDTKPVAKNDTPEGRQSNRRVELVKL